MTAIDIYPYKMGSQAAKNLQIVLKQIGNSVVRRKLSPPSGNLVINYGRRELVETCGQHENILNHPELVSLTSNKLTFFQTYGTLPFVIDHYTDHEEVLHLLERGKTIVARTLLRSRSGRGIEILNGLEGIKKLSELRNCKLFTRYFKKTHEFRVHLMRYDNETLSVIDFAQKKRSRSVPDDEVNWQVRSTENGFIYAREDVSLPQAIKDINTYLCNENPFQLDFYAVDYLYHSPTGTAKICEINTAPGLEGTTVTRYADAIEDYISRTMP